VYFDSEKDIAQPTMNRKKGNTKSVGVQPCHSACSSGGYTCSQLPGLFTRIIEAIAIPRKTSRDFKRMGEKEEVRGKKEKLLIINYQLSIITYQLSIITYPYPLPLTKFQFLPES
jgi:hypothetical protein